MSELETGVPDRVPQPTQQLVVGLTPAGVHQHDVEVAVRRQDAAARTHRRPSGTIHRHRPRAGHHLVEQRDQPRVDRCGPRLAPRPPAQVRVGEQPSAAVGDRRRDHPSHRRTPRSMHPVATGVPTLARMRRTAAIERSGGAAGRRRDASWSHARRPTARPPPARSSLRRSTSARSPVEDGILQLGVLLPLSGAGTEIGSVDARRHRVGGQRDQRPAVGGVNGRAGQSVRRGRGCRRGHRARLARQAARTRCRRDHRSGVVADRTRRSCRSRIAGRCVDVLAHAPARCRSTTTPTTGCSSAPFRPTRCRPSPSPGAIEQTGKPTAGASPTSTTRTGRPFAELVSTSWRGAASTCSTDGGLRPRRHRLQRRGRPRCSTPAPTVVAVIGDSGAGPRMVEALYRRHRRREVEIIVNDAMRVPADGQHVRTAGRRGSSAAVGRVAAVAHHRTRRSSSGSRRRTPTRVACSRPTRTTAST